jgi:2-polyprenyl-6-methoxyphenol hydroxylase-like FAD-dependent oxidoreductase
VYSDAGECKHVIPFGADDRAQGLFLRRSDLVNEMYRHATVHLGLDLRFGVTVDEHWETDTAAGVSINGKEKITGHCIIAADGLYSKARAIITGDEPLEDAAALLQTGGAIFRSNFDASEVANDPGARWVLEGTSEHDRHEIYFGRDVTVLVGTIGKGKYVWWNCPHRVCVLFHMQQPTI